VRVGTHAVSSGSATTLWNRLRTHRGSGDGRGNHRASIFRFHSGDALSARYPHLHMACWRDRRARGPKVKLQEEPLERAVSEYLGAMGVLWLDVGDEPGPSSDRAYIERNIIGLLSRDGEPSDPPSASWLGLHSPRPHIRRFGLWNLDHLEYPYISDCLDVLEECVLITAGKSPRPTCSIAPSGWYAQDGR